MDQQSDKPGFNVELDSSGNFTVGASKTISYLFGGLFFAMFVGILVSTDFNFGQYFMIYLFGLIAPLAFIAPTFKNNKTITINSTGIYHNKTFITDWTNFNAAYIRQRPNSVSANNDGLTDHYQIVVDFFDSYQSKIFRYPIPMADAQDKSEYEIIDAIIYFSGKQLTHEIYD